MTLLRGVDLGGASLSGTSLGGASLSGASVDGIPIRADVRIERGLVTEIGTLTRRPGEETAGGGTLLPGLVDEHLHLHGPGRRGRLGRLQPSWPRRHPAYGQCRSRRLGPRHRLPAR